jgi:hypothetical protein
VPQTPANLTSIPIEVDIGGVATAVAYHGRSIYPGLDQINVVIPQSVQLGCFVSVVALSGASIGNFATIPVAASGRTCADTTTGYSGAQLQALYNVGSIPIGSNTIPPRTVNAEPIPAETSTNA